MQEATDTTRCPTCGRETPRSIHCAYCGALLHPAGDERLRRFAAAPQQHLLAPAIVATLFPHLPRRGHNTFRFLLAMGAVVIGGLALAGLFPLALIAAAVLVPLLAVLYFHEVDVYEREPVRVFAFTVGWGVATGVALGFLHDAVESAGAVLAPQTTAHAVLWDGLLLPLIGLVAVLLGPLALLAYRRFNDVLDGVAFGGAAAATFAGGWLLAHSATFLSVGLAPTGLVAPWTVRLLTLGLAMPVLDAAAIGAATGSFWLRYRASVEERRRYGLLARPALAVVCSAILLAGASLLQLYLDPWGALAALIALDAIALVWLRVLIHVGLVEERSEAGPAPATPCLNCHRAVAHEAFCSYCGVAVRALPKQGRPHGRRDRAVAIARFSVALAASVAIALIVIAAVEPASYRPLCAHALKGCETPLRLTGAGGPGRPAPEPRTWKGLGGVEVAYDARRWRPLASGPTGLEITYQNRLELSIKPSRNDSVGEEQLLESQLGSLRGRYPDLALDAAHPLTSAAIGSVSAIGGFYAGHDALDGRPVEALVEVASDAGLQVSVSVWTSQQAEASVLGAATPFDVLVQADAVLESFSWPHQFQGASR